MINKIINNASQIGLHISYNAGKDCTYEEIVKEKNNLEIITNAPMVKNRNHYLRAIGMESFRNLIDAGIHEDYTMGYADCAGFRLGTAQCINWIDPEKLVVTSLKLHPLTMMEGSLTGYMGLNEKEAYEYTCLLFENVKKNGGEFTMLFHNSSFNIPGANWMKSFYVNILKYISDRYGE